jgi:para-nitrobenzyl esterase
MFERGAALVAELGCDAAPDELDCLRAVADLDDVVRSFGTNIEIGLTLPASLEVAPNVDGVLLLEDPFERIARGDGPDVPVMIGSNADEAYLFTLTRLILTVAAYENAVTDLLGDLAAGVLAAYPAADFARPKAAYDALVTDVGFVCPALSFAEAAAGGLAPSFGYHFTQALTGPLSAGGAFHGLELMYVFDHFSDSYTPTPDDVALVQDVQQAWTSFARTGAPEASPGWPAFDAASPSIMILDVPLEVQGDIREGRCADLRALGLAPAP